MRDQTHVRQPVPSGLIADIDRLRGVFAIMVLLGHAIDIAVQNAVPDVFQIPFKHLRPYCGFIWVVGFVVLSGFCIEASCRNMGRDFHFGRYLALRATRLLPTLMVATLLAGIFEALVLGSPFRPQVWTTGIDGKHFWLNLFGLGGFFGPFGSINPSYTISFELLYYGLWGGSRWVLRGASARRLVAVNAAFAFAAVLLLKSGLLTLPPLLAEVFGPSSC